MTRWLGCIALSVGLLLPLPAAVRAAPLEFLLQFEVTQVLGPRVDLLGSLVTGGLSVDDALLDGSGDGVVAGSEMTLELFFLGQTYTQINDVDYPAFPRFVFSAFTPVFANILFTKDNMGVAFSDPDIVYLAVYGDLVDGGGVIVGPATVLTAQVPLPAALPLAAGALAGLAALARHRRAALRL